MRSYIKEYKLYQFEELTEKAKEKAKDDYLINYVDILVSEFEAYAEEYLSDKYPDSDLHVEFDFSYYQGSGLNIYGNFSLNDFNYEGNYSWLLEYVDNFKLGRHYDGYAYSLKKNR